MLENFLGRYFEFFVFFLFISWSKMQSSGVHIVVRPSPPFNYRTLGHLLANNSLSPLPDAGTQHIPSVSMTMKLPTLGT
jgi:hypothetical protein